MKEPIEKNAAVERTRNSIKRKISFTLLLFVCLALLFVAREPAEVFANGNTPPGETVPGAAVDPCAELRARLEKLEAEKRARQQRAAAARRRAAQAKKVADQKAAAAELERLRLEAERQAREEAILRTLLTSRNLVQEGRYHSALRMLRSFLKEHPHSADGWYWIARAHHALGDYDRAQTAVNIALEIDPRYPALDKTPSGLQPIVPLTKQQRKEPPPSMSVLPVKQPLPARLQLEPMTVSFPRLIPSRSSAASMDELPETMEAEVSERDPATGAYLLYEPYPPLAVGRTVLWQQSEAFNEISRWRFRVDRMGILAEPRVPVAWKGSTPYEIYFWTGTEWARVRRQKHYFDHKETYDEIMAYAAADIAAVLDERGFMWLEEDTPALAASASLMRYRWMGDVDLTAAHARVEKRARERGIGGDWDELRRQANDHQDSDGKCPPNP